MKTMILIGSILLTSGICRAQQTSIQATIVDPNGFAYQFLTGSASINCPGNQAPLYNGFTVPRSYTITGGDGNGHFTMVLYDVNAITPAGCSYNFAITAQNGFTNFIAPSIGGSGSGTPITGTGPVNLSTPINAFAVLLPVVGGSILGSIASTQVAFGTALNTIGGSTKLIWLNANEQLEIGDPTSGLNAGTVLPLGVWAVNGIHRNTSTSPQDVGVLGIVEADNGVNNSANAIAGGYFSASALTNLYTVSCCGTLVGVQGIGSALHPTGTAGQVIGGLFTGNIGGAGPVGDLAGMAAQVSITGSGLATLASAIRVYSAVVSGGVPPTGLYGININNVTGGVSNWAIFTGTGKVEFGDQLIEHGPIVFVEGSAPTPASGDDVCQGVTATHTLQCTFNNGSAVSMAQVTAVPLSIGSSTGNVVVAPNGFFVCTAACTVTPPLPTAGVQFCIMNDDNVSSIITLGALGGSGQYEATARTSYGTAGTGTMTSAGAAADQICILGRDSTHYITKSFTGTWTAH